MARRELSAPLQLLCLALCVLAQEETREPPTITYPLSFNETMVYTGSKVELKCTATGIPKPHFEWRYNAEPVPVVKTPDRSYDDTTGTLTITKVQVAHEGFYQCYAKNTFSNGQQAVAMAHKNLLTVSRIGDFIRVGDRNVNAQAGQYLRMECDDPQNFPQDMAGTTNFKWVKVQGVFTDIPLDLDNGRLFIDTEGTLHFTYVKEMDRLEDGGGWMYKCALSIPSANTQKLSRNPVKLSVASVPNIPESKPILQYISHNPKVTTFERGSEGMLECFFSGYVNDPNNNLPKVTWWDMENKPILSNNKYEVIPPGRQLKIKELREEDEKDYKCKGVNSLGEYEGIAVLNVTSKPIFTDALKPQVVTEGNDATFTCKARSASGELEPEKPRWYRNGQRLDLIVDPNKYQFSEDRKQLTIKSGQKNSDIACYQCVVENSIGEVFSDACLNVILPITFVTKPEEEQVISEGSIIELTVVAKGDPIYPLQYRWIFRNKTYENNDVPPYMEYDPVTMKAIINTTGFDDVQLQNVSGVYAREIYNSKQNEVVFVKVTWKNEPPVIVPVVVVAGFDFWIIGLIIGILIIIIVLIIICCVICRRKMLEGQYLVGEKEHKAGLDPEKELLDSGFHDLSRADCDDFPEKKLAPNIVDFDGFPDDDNESFGSADYDGETTAFNEDGSFIGVYNKDKKGPPPYKQNASESNV